MMSNGCVNKIYRSNFATWVTLVIRIIIIPILFRLVNTGLQK